MLKRWAGFDLVDCCRYTCMLGKGIIVLSKVHSYSQESSYKCTDGSWAPTPLTMQWQQPSPVCCWSQRETLEAEAFLNLAAEGSRQGFK